MAEGSNGESIQIYGSKLADGLQAIETSLRGIYVYTSMASPAHFNAEVSPDGAGLGVGRVGLSQHHSSRLHSIQTLPHLRERDRESGSVCNSL